MQRAFSLSIMALACLVLAPASHAQSGTASVDSMSSIFSQASNSQGSVDGTGIPGVSITLTPGVNRVLTLSSVT